jgi:hypothetical protein
MLRCPECKARVESSDSGLCPFCDAILVEDTLLEHPRLESIIKFFVVLIFGWMLGYAHCFIAMH